MDLPRPSLLGALAIALSFCRVSPLSTSSPATGTFRGGRGSSTTATSSSRTSSFRSSIRSRRQPHHHLVATAAAAALVAAVASPPLVTGERTPVPGRSRRRRSAQVGHLGQQNVRRQAALLCTADGGSGAAPVAADEAAATATATAAETPRVASPPAPGKPGTLSDASSGGGDAAEDGSGRSGTTFREAFNGGLPDWLLTRLEELGFATPTLVQRQALEVILGDERNDAVLHAQTGSGKTLAFLLPLFALIDPSRSAVQGLVVVPTRELGLQVAGVAKRLAAGAGSGRDKKIQVMSVLEGSSNKRQRAWAWADPPHIVIGNPESLSRLVTTGAIRVNAVSYVVVDEVDACLLSEGTRSWLHELLARSLSPTHADEQDQEDDEEAARLVAIGAGRVAGAVAPVNKRVKDRQTVFASATVPQHKHFIKQCVQKQWTLTEPVHVQVHAKESMPPCLSHFYVVCPPEQKLAVLRALVRRELGVPAAAAAAAATETPSTTTPTASTGAAEKGHGGDQPSGQRSGGENSGGDGAKAVADTRGLVFALPTKPLEAIATSLDKALGGGGGGVVGDGRISKQQAKRNGGAGTGGPAPPPLAEFLREELGLNARADTMLLFREGKTRLLVSTDLAARGLDVPEITHVFNLDLPLDGEGYVHRGGRAGRMGRPGKVISLVTPKQEFVIRRLGNGIGVDIKKISLGSSKRKRSPKPPSPDE